MPSQRKRLIAGNWKMNKTYTEAVVLAQDLSYKLKEDAVDDVEVVVCPPFVDLKGVQGVIEMDAAPYSLGAQNVYWEKSGAYTGEISCDMLLSCGCTYCIVGHSERRDYFGETDEDINKKIAALLGNNIIPISCCGESLEVREAGHQVEYVVNQIREDLDNIDLKSGEELVIAYEPIWAIGTGKTATPEDAQEVCGAIREILTELYSANIAGAVRILYGGSAKPENVAGFLACADVDGALVGGASLQADDFALMVKRSSH